jgi:hypothetical protein
MLRLNRNKEKTHPNDLKETLGLFRFVTKQFCLFRLFRYRFETPKQAEIFGFWFHETNRNKLRNRSCFGLFRFEPKFIFVCFEDTLFETSFDLKQPKLVSALSETKRLFGLFRFNTVKRGKIGHRG